MREFRCYNESSFYSSHDEKEKDVTAILTVSWAFKDESGVGRKS